MDTISQTTFSNAFFMNEKLCSLIRLSLKFVPMDPINNNSVLVHVMACRRKGDKPLPGTMMTQLNDAYMRHWERWVKGSQIKVAMFIRLETVKRFVWRQSGRWFWKRSDIQEHIVQPWPLRSVPTLVYASISVSLGVSVNAGGYHNTHTRTHVLSFIETHPHAHTYIRTCIYYIYWFSKYEKLEYQMLLFSFQNRQLTTFWQSCWLQVITFINNDHTPFFRTSEAWTEAPGSWWYKIAITGQIIAESH